MSSGQCSCWCDPVQLSQGEREWVELTAAVVEQATLLRADHLLRTPDALRAAISASRGQRSPQHTRSSSTCQENCCSWALREREAMGGLRVGPLCRRGAGQGPVHD